ncbi:prolyl oligopeptidase family serine peptidase [Gelidibacter salicanalis]|uniref:Prolyl oligopeptidase family serine peptidase n=1 Tax=Gelidibacter salicanalis TaxID=291193 RepID=A0A5C7AH88_9FLAO|nr:prolyl oligopeptidase family serine peptidase [Gelidibacter salicanalis]TXE07918.1 prolyl oligopeptidase family serine peptidase [Gelidibacter salicanalis]
MCNNLKLFCVILFLVGVSTHTINAQKTGNIVEYFGKEKINEVSEGNVLHVFKTGLALQMQNLSFESSSFPNDPVFNRFLNDTKYRATKESTFDIDFLGNSSQWQSIKIDSTSSFSGRYLRSAYVQLTYTSNSEQTVLFEASGHSVALVNGFPHEGDHYDFGYSLIPIKLKKGENIFVLKVGRFPRIRARLITPSTGVQFTTRDMTMPNILQEESKPYQGAIRVVNATEYWIKDAIIEAKIADNITTTVIANIPPLSVQKVPFSFNINAVDTSKEGVDLQLNLKDNKGTHINNQTVPLEVKSKYKHHKKTFVSAIDGSVQYYSVAPSTTKEASQALFLSVHGASVEAVNQANAYAQKDWGTLVAPTNRRPFGFAWEDWGRLDALEVLADAKTIYQPDESKIYLTGHSMGGHGTWYLGATYPDRFAAIAPCAGYPDLLAYRDGFSRTVLEMTSEQLEERGISIKTVERMKWEPVNTPLHNIIERAGTPSRTLKLERNYLQSGVYVLHGEKDNVVPTAIAREMRERLGKFHNDFTYYEYPDGTHWYGNHSVDWQPIFDFFKQRTIPKDSTVKKLEFFTGSPGVSATSHFMTIYQQEKPFEVSSFDFSKEKGFDINTNNVVLLEVDLSKLNESINEITIDGDTLKVSSNLKNFFKKDKNNWAKTSKPSLKEKGPHRNGGFKDAFRNNVVFVYATNGSTIENDWYYHKALFDAETFYYRANGNVDMIKDTDFSLEKYADRNVIVYGNKDNNTAWKVLLKDSPIQVTNNEVRIGDKTLSGNQWGLYYTIPRTDSDVATIGVITATGELGMKAAYANHYLVNGTTFPDVIMFDNNLLNQGTNAVKYAGFFGNDWTIENGDFEWK